MGLVAEDAFVEGEPLTGGVSSDIWKVALSSKRTICIKRALPELKVDQTWEAPVARNHFEAEWLKLAHKIVPESVIEIIAEDTKTGSFAMEYLPLSDYSMWKNDLRDGLCDIDVAASVAESIAAIHSATANKKDIEEKFATDDLFHALRIEPFILTAAKKHADMADRLLDIAANLASTKIALVHGDISPKNILVGPKIIIVDAECAWYGDPAFDLAFLLNHLLLKCIWKPEHREKYLACFEAAWTAYKSHISWEECAPFEKRTVDLLLALILARVDGKSPAEYITATADQQMIRDFVRRHLAMSGLNLPDIASEWELHLDKK